MKTIIISNSHGYYQAGKRSGPLAFDHPLRERIMKEDKQKLFVYPEWWGSREIKRYIMANLPSDIKAIDLVPNPEKVGKFLTGRVAKANSLKADLYLSIHSDAFGMGEFNTAHGFSTFYHSAKEEAEIFNRHMALMLPDRKNRGLVWNNTFHEIVGVKHKAVLTENLFYTNELEVRFLLDNLEAIGQAHTNAIIEWSKL